MGFKYYKNWESGSLADGASFEQTWYPDIDITIKRIHIARTTGESLTDSTLYLKVKENVYTHEVAPAIILGPDILTSPVLDIPVPAKAVIAFVFKNREGVAIAVMVTFECWTP